MPVTESPHEQSTMKITARLRTPVISRSCTSPLARRLCEGAVMRYSRFHSFVFLFVLLSICNAMMFAQTGAPDFSVVVIPDPQNLSEENPAAFKSQTLWIVNNAATLNIRMVVGEGDLVNHDASVTEWANADAAMRVLD